MYNKQITDHRLQPTHIHTYVYWYIKYRVIPYYIQVTPAGIVLINSSSIIYMIDQ